MSTILKNQRIKQESRNPKPFGVAGACSIRGKVIGNEAREEESHFQKRLQYSA